MERQRNGETKKRRERETESDEVSSTWDSSKLIMKKKTGRLESKQQC